jgi:hypothetical protein
VALAHLNGIKIKEAANKRFILNNKSLWFKEVAEILKAEYGKWYKFKTGELKYCTMKIASFFDSSAEIVLPMWGKTFNLDHSQSEKILNIEYRDLKETIIEMAEAMIKLNIIADKRIKK